MEKKEVQMKAAQKAVFVCSAVILLWVMMGCASGERYVVHHADGTVLDTKTNLMWAAKDNGSDISWKDAKAYCESFGAGSYRDWRMPTAEELATLYDASKTRKAPCAANFEIHNATEAIGMTCLSIWSSDTKGNDAVLFNYVYGNASPYLQSHTYAARALPVRTHK
jgi:hypothetical protein